MNKNRLLYFLSQPHQPFFALGVLSAIVFMAIFIPAYRGVISIDSNLFHSYSMIFIIFTNFFYGFTLTTFTRFSAKPPIDSRRYLRLFVLNLISFLSMLIYLILPLAFFVASIATAISLSYLIRIFYDIYKEANEPKNDQYMIIVSFGMAVVSNLLFILSQIPCSSCNTDILKQFGIEIGVYLYMILLATVIAFRMVPFFSRVLEYQKSSYFHLLLTTLLISHVLLSQTHWVWVSDLLLAILLIIETMRADLPFPNPDPLLWGLHIAIYWLGFGFLISSIVEFFSAFYSYQSLYMPIHLLVLGFLTTILIAFGTRVTLGHGQAPLIVSRAGKFLFIFVQIVVAFRVILSITASEGKLFPFFDISATLWIVMFVWWIGLYGKVLLFGGDR